jgi:hypothetical protein
MRIDYVIPPTHFTVGAGGRDCLWFERQVLTFVHHAWGEKFNRQIFPLLLFAVILL